MKLGITYEVVLAFIVKAGPLVCFVRHTSCIIHSKFGVVRSISMHVVQKGSRAYMVQHFCVSKLCTAMLLDFETLDKSI